MESDESIEALRAQMEEAAASEDREAVAVASQKLAFRLLAAGHLAEAEALARESIEIAVYTDSDLLQLQGLLALAAVLGRRGELDEALSLNRRALAMAEGRGDDPWISVALDQLAHLHCTRRELTEAEHYMRRSVEISEKTGNKDSLAVACGNLGVVLMDSGRLEEAEEWVNHALEAERVRGNQAGVAGAYSNLGLIRARQGRAEESAAFFQQALEAAQLCSDEAEQATVYLNLGSHHLGRGELDQAERFLAQALEINERLGRPTGTAGCLGNLGLIADRKGQLEKAVELHTRALEIHAQLGDPVGASKDHGNLAGVYAEMGETSKVEAALEDLFSIQRDQGWDADAVRTLLHLTDTYCRQGRVNAGRAACQRALDLASEHGIPELQAEAYYVLGTLAAMAGDPETAFESLRQSLDLLEAAGASDQAFEVRQLLRQLRQNGSHGTRQEEASGAGVDIADRFEPESGEERAVWLQNRAVQLMSAHRGDVEVVEQALSWLREAARELPEDAPPELRATIFGMLGDTFKQRGFGDRGENVEEAIRATETALAVLDRRRHGALWARVTGQLGNLLRERLSGDQVANVERAIELLRDAMSELMALGDEIEVALVRTGLTAAYLSRRSGRRQDNLVLAHRLSDQARAALNRELYPLEWAIATLNLATSTMELPGSDGTPDYGSAIDLLTDALQVLSRQHTPLVWAVCLLQLGSAHYLRGRDGLKEQLEPAIAALEACLTVFNRSSQPEEWQKAMAQLGESYLLRWGGNHRANLERGIEILETLIASCDGPAIEAARASLAFAYLQRIGGRPAENAQRAIGLLGLNVESSRETADPCGLAESLVQLSTGYFALGMKDRSDDDFRRALAACEEALELITPEAARTWAAVRLRQGETYVWLWSGDRSHHLEDAIRAFEDAHQVAAAAGQRNLAIMAKVGLGNAYRERLHGDRTQNRERAIEYLTEAVGQLDRNQAPEDWAQAQMNLGVAYRERVLGDFDANQDRAIRLYEDVLSVLGSDTRPQAWALASLNLGVALNDWNQLEPAERAARSRKHLEDALRVFTRETSPKFWAVAMENLAIAQWRLGQPEKALGALLEAEQELTPERAPYHSARLRLKRATFLAESEENWESALECTRSVLALLTLREVPQLCLDAAVLQGRIESRQGDWTAASASFRTALEAEDWLEREALLQSSKQIERAGRHHLHSDAATAMARGGALNEAALVLERGRARFLGESLARGQLDLSEASPADREAIEDYRSAVAELGVIEAEDLSRGWVHSRGGYPQVTSDLRKRAEAASSRLESALKRIRWIPGNRYLAEPSRESEIASAASSAPLAYLVTAATESLVFLCRPREGDPSKVEVSVLRSPDLSGAELTTLLFGTAGERDGLLFGQVSGVTMERALEHALPRLGRTLIGPMAALLRAWGARRVTLVPTGHLGLFPFHAARYERDGETISLLDEFEVSYAPSARTLNSMSATASRLTGEPPTLAAVANPLPHPKPLAFAADEVTAVARLFPSGVVQLHGENATKQALMEAVRGARYVHLACHGLYDVQRPLDSYLHLGAGDRLELGEVVAIRGLEDTRLVTLSACQTGLFDLTALVDEYIGFPAACVFAGAACVLATLWPANDIPATLLMLRFYRLHLIGDSESGQPAMSPAAALRAAQLWLRNAKAGELLAELEEGRTFESKALAAGKLGSRLATVLRLQNAERRPFAHPRVWAPFVLVGT